GHLFSSRQLVALITFSDLVQETRVRVTRDACAASMPDDDVRLDAGGTGATAYADAVASMLAITVDKAADYWSTLCFWHNRAAQQKTMNTFARQSPPMAWDHAEGNPFSVSSVHFLRFVSLAAEVLDSSASARPPANVDQQDAVQGLCAEARVVSTDPPYFDNI